MLDSQYYTVSVKKIPDVTRELGSRPKYQIIDITPEDVFIKNNNDSLRTQNTAKANSAVLRRTRGKHEKPVSKAVSVVYTGLSALTAAAASLALIFGFPIGQPVSGQPGAIQPDPFPLVDEGSTDDKAVAEWFDQNGIVYDDANVNNTPETVVETPEVTVEGTDESVPEVSDAPEITNTQSAQEILANNPEVNEAYTKLNEALTRFSNQLGEDAPSLIQERVALLGNNRVDPIDVAKILYIESRGRIYDPETGDIYRNSQSGATGPFQVKPSTVDYINYYYNLTGSDALDVENPYDNLDACILYLRLINALRVQDVAEGKELLTGDNVKLAMAWGYHDGPWSETISPAGSDYISDFDMLSAADNYPQVINYLLG